jgi:hypothetical protein
VIFLSLIFLSFLFPRITPRFNGRHQREQRSRLCDWFRKLKSIGFARISRS